MTRVTATADRDSNRVVAVDTARSVEEVSSPTLAQQEEQHAICLCTEPFYTKVAIGSSADLRHVVCKNRTLSHMRGH